MMVPDPDPWKKMSDPHPWLQLQYWIELISEAPNICRLKDPDPVNFYCPEKDPDNFLDVRICPLLLRFPINVFFFGFVGGIFPDIDFFFYLSKKERENQNPNFRWLVQVFLAGF